MHQSNMLMPSTILLPLPTLSMFFPENVLTAAFCAISLATGWSLHTVAVQTHLHQSSDQSMAIANMIQPQEFLNRSWHPTAPGGNLRMNSFLLSGMLVDEFMHMTRELGGWCWCPFLNLQQGSFAVRRTGIRLQSFRYSNICLWFLVLTQTSSGSMDKFMDQNLPQ